MKELKFVEQLFITESFNDKDIKIWNIWWYFILFDNHCFENIFNNAFDGLWHSWRG